MQLFLSAGGLSEVGFGLGDDTLLDVLDAAMQADSIHDGGIDHGGLQEGLKTTAEALGIGGFHLGDDTLEGLGTVLADVIGTLAAIGA